MNVLYEEEGALKAAAVLADNTTSLQVEAAHGKRSKIKAAAVLLRFEQPPLAGFMAEAQQLAADIDIDFMWECCGEDEFGYEGLARDYFGHAPGATEAAAVLLRLHGAPMYFYKKGRGRYKAAPEPALKAALAGVERKRQQALQKERYLAALAAGELPPEFLPLRDMLLYRPDKANLEWKALEEAAAAQKITPLRLLERCGAMPAPHEYHLGRFLFAHFPRGTAFQDAGACGGAPELPLAGVAAFSIDDAATTEIDDAFSLQPLAGGGWRVGIHIAAPALGIVSGTALDAAARERMSTVYYPGGKITMLPEAAIADYTLNEGESARPALSLYADLDAQYEVVATDTRIERVCIAENLRHHALEALADSAAMADAPAHHPRGAELRTLWEWAQHLERRRLGGEPQPEQRAEYAFHVDDGHITITRRLRGAPVDKLVSELMIYVNSEWGKRLADAAIPAIYRVQGGGKVRMSTVAAAHAGLGVACYAWTTSPLRRYVDLANQRQLLALVRGEVPPYTAGDDKLLAVMHDFETAHEAYNEFQRGMERYWSLRWLQQEKIESVSASVLRENLVRLDDLPLVLRVPSLPAQPVGTRVVLTVSDIDLLELTLHCVFTGEPGAVTVTP